MDEITGNEDVLDSRDIESRIEELLCLRAGFQAEHDLSDYPGYGMCEEDSEWNEWDENEGEELTNLEALAEEGRFYSDWRCCGKELVNDRFFEDYARRLAEDCCMINKDLSWPLCHIDWEEAAEALKQYYTSIDFGEHTFWIRD